MTIQTCETLGEVTTWKEVTIKCPYGVDVKLSLPPRVLSGEEEVYTEIYCDSRLQTSLTCPNYDKCNARHFVIEVKDKKIRSLKEDIIF